MITMCDKPKGAVHGSIPHGEITFHCEFESPSEIRGNNAEILADFRALRDDIDSWLAEIFPDCPDTRNDKQGA
jgi:hypothetical protein